MNILELLLFAAFVNISKSTAEGTIILADSLETYLLFMCKCDNLSL